MLRLELIEVTEAIIKLNIIRKIRRNMGLLF